MKSQKAVRIAKRKRQRQVRWLGLVVTGAVMLLAVAGLLIRQNQPSSKAPLEVSGSPSLRVDREAVDLGDMKLGQIARVAFQITNVGDQPLKLTQDPYIEVVEGC